MFFLKKQTSPCEKRLHFAYPKILRGNPPACVPAFAWWVFRIQNLPFNFGNDGCDEVSPNFPLIRQSRNQAAEYKIVI